MNIVLYSTGCPMCLQLKHLLKQKNISYEECSDMNKMTELGLTYVPALQIDGKLLSTKDSMQWVIKQ